MPNLLKSSVVWQFTAGFALGALGLMAAHIPAEQPARTAPIVATAK